MSSPLKPSNPTTVEYSNIVGAQVKDLKTAFIYIIEVLKREGVNPLKKPMKTQAVEENE